MVVYERLCKYWLERWEIQKYVSASERPYAQNVEKVMIVHESLQIFIFIFAGWTDPPQFCFRHIMVTYTPIVVPPFHHIQSTLPVPLCHHHGYLSKPDIIMFASSSSLHFPPVCLPLPWALRLFLSCKLNLSWLPAPFTPPLAVGSVQWPPPLLCLLWALSDPLLLYIL